MATSRRTRAADAPSSQRDAPAHATPQTATPPSVHLKGRLTLETPLGALLSDSRIRLLEAIERCGSLNRAAKEVPLSYKAAWDALDAMNKLAPEPLVERSTGGSGGGGTKLTPHARQLIALYRAMESSQQDILDRLPSPPVDTEGPALRSLLRRMTMRTSARNQFPARVAALTDRGGLVDVALRIGEDGGPQDTLVATITPESMASMELQLGSDLYALIKAPAMGIATKAPAVEDGHNALPGRIASLRPDRVSTGVTLQLPSGLALHAVVDNTTATRLTVGDTAWATFSGDQIVLVTFG